MVRSLVSVTIVLASAQPLFAQTLRTSAPISDVRYQITADSSAVGRRQLGVSMSFHVSGAAPVVLALPAWSPGHYVLIWFARRVLQFSAESNGALQSDVHESPASGAGSSPQVHLQTVGPAFDGGAKTP